MIKSMTGFGHGEKETGQYKITVEIKSVNHRYCDLSVKLPKKFNAFESRIRNVMKEYVARGKTDLYIVFENYSSSKCKVEYHQEVAEAYVAAIDRAGESFGLERGLTGSGLVRFPEVITLSEEEQDMEEIFPALEEVLRQAGRHFVESREAEGANLRQDILKKLDFIQCLISYIEERSPEMLKEYRDKLRKKVEEALGDVHLDESVLSTELVVYADKVCVDEETVRLRSHVENLRSTMEAEGTIGRKLDFIVQEMNREANTILSKANDQALSEHAIDLKTEIEKIREQIQNIE
ncbi:MAG: YicC family protein [Lachnospiraceae bacterium]|nr:YicC family protein [Lachnospiraceae bacterium]